MDETVFAHLAPVAIDEEGDLREGKERDADRQDDVEAVPRQAVSASTSGHGDGIDAVDEEIRILVVGEQPQVQHQRHDQRALAGRSRARTD
ncbi:hypothetical protein D3C72_2075840 [compost metagenome]